MAHFLPGFLACVLAGSSLQLPARAQTQLPVQAERKPIQEAQLRNYLQDSLLLGASQQHIQEGLAATRKTLPPWFPDKVWSDVQQAIAAVDLPALLLPLYQRYFTEQDGQALELRFSGPTGHAYAQALLDARLAAVHQGLEGSAAEQTADKASSRGEIDRLFAAHVATLSPEERATIQATAASHTKADGYRIDDEQNVILNTKMNQVLHAVLAADDAQLRAAQRAYQAKH